MELWGDRRGQPVQIGFILLFGILVLAFAGYQGYVVPNQNAEIEFNHFDTVENQFAELETNLVNSEGSESERSTTFTLGTQYPSRLLALNPPPVAGTLSTTDPGTVNVARAGGPVCREGGGLTTTRSLRFSPNYNEYSSARSMTYENRFIAQTYRDGTVYGDTRMLERVEGGPDRIDLLLLTGDVRENDVGNYNLRVNVTHRYSTEADNPNVTVPTQTSVEDWRNEILADYSDIVVSAAGPDRVELDFRGGTYRVSCAVAGLDGDPAFRPPEDTSTPAAGEANTTYNTRWNAVEVNGNSRTVSSPIEVQPSDTVRLTMRATGRESGLGIENPFVDYTFAYDVVNDGDYQFGQSPNQISGSEDTIEFDVPDSSEAVDGDSFEAYVTAGDDSDVLVFNVRTISTPPSFSVLSGYSTTRGLSNNIDTVWFSWSTDGDVSSTTFETRTPDGTLVDSTSPSNPESGFVSVDGGNNPELELVAITTGPAGTETCRLTIQGFESFSRSDFTCTTS